MEIAFLRADGLLFESSFFGILEIVGNLTKETAGSTASGECTVDSTVLVYSVESP